jgi:hypothetical protein
MAIYPKSVTNLAQAIAHVEGFGVLGSVPTRAHNPGDLKIPNWKGPVTGNEGISVFPDDDTGWKYLYDQLLRIQVGNSHIYKTSMTFSEFAFHWTDTQESSWLENVIYKLKVLGYSSINEDTTLADFFSFEL